MAYTHDVYQAVDRQFEERRRAAQSELNSRKAELYRAVPRLREIEREMQKTGEQVIGAVLGERGTGSLPQKIEVLKQTNLSLQEERGRLLTEHGYPEDFLGLQFLCSKCMGEGFIDGKMCSCYKKSLEKEACGRMAKTSPLHLSSFKAFKLHYYDDQPDPAYGVSPQKNMQKIFEACQKYAKDFGTGSPSLLFLGPTGLGKTHLSLAIASEVTRKGWGVVYNCAQNIFTVMENEKFGRDNTAGQGSDMFLDCDLLILDDLGTEFITQFSKAALYQILNTRILRRVPTIISTNFTVDELYEKYPDSIMSRIMGCFKAYTFLGRDIRQQIKSKKT